VEFKISNSPRGNGGGRFWFPRKKRKPIPKGFKQDAPESGVLEVNNPIKEAPYPKKGSPEMSRDPEPHQTPEGSTSRKGYPAKHKGQTKKVVTIDAKGGSFTYP